MEDLPGADSPPPTTEMPLPEANNDAQEPVNPDIDEENSSKTPPFAEPTLDMEATEDAADTNGHDNDNDNDIDNDQDQDEEQDFAGHESDALSEVDEAQFEDFDPNAIAIEERPKVVDASHVALLGKYKRKRGEGEEGGEKKKKRKEGRREKPKRSKKRADGEDDTFDAQQDESAEGRRRRKKGSAEGAGVERKRRQEPEENLDDLPPEERRKKEFSRLLDQALAKPKTQRRRGGIDLEQMADAELEDMRKRMADAAQADTLARDAGKPAMHKLQLLPEVVALLNRNTLQQSLVDPDINLLESVRFFLEPLNDGSLPAYNIQRELFGCLSKLPIGKDALVASGIGKVVHFYTRSPRAENSIKRQAERLVGEWTRPILKRSDDYRKREFKEANYDPSMAPVRSSQALDKATKAAAARKKALDLPMANNRARVEGGLSTYTIVPKATTGSMQPGVRRLGAAGDDMFRRLKNRHGGRR